MQIDESHILTDYAAFREIAGRPNERAGNKTIHHIDRHCRAFIEASPFVVLGTRGTDGLIDLSPKGDPAGFVKVLDPHTLVLPDRLGNRRFDSYENIFSDPSVTLIFLIPGYGITLRVAGKARITTQPDLLDSLSVKGRAPTFALVIGVEEAFLHCTKCMVRSGMWQPEAWPDITDLPTLGEAVKDHSELAQEVAELDRLITEDLAARLY